MKKRTAFIGAILSLIPFGQPLLIKTSVVLSTSGIMLSIPENVNAESADFYFDRAFEKGNNGDYYGAISDYTKAIEINPNDGVAFYNRGWNKAKLKDYYGAIFDFTKVINLNPKDAEAFSNRGIAKENLGDLDGACSDWIKASELGYERAAEWVNDQC